MGVSCKPQRNTHIHNMKLTILFTLLAGIALAKKGKGQGNYFRKGPKGQCKKGKGKCDKGSLLPTINGQNIKELGSVSNSFLDKLQALADDNGIKTDVDKLANNLKKVYTPKIRQGGKRAQNMLNNAVNGKGKFGKYGKLADKLTINKLTARVKKEAKEFQASIKNKHLKNAFGKLTNDGMEQFNEATKKMKGKSKIIAAGKRQFNQNQRNIQQGGNKLIRQALNEARKNLN